MFLECMKTAMDTATDTDTATDMDYFSPVNELQVNEGIEKNRSFLESRCQGMLGL